MLDRDNTNLLLVAHFVEPFIQKKAKNDNDYMIHIKNGFSINLLWQNLYCSHGLECVNLD